MEPDRMPRSGHDPTTDRAVAVLRDLDSLKTDEPTIAKPLERLVARVIDLTVLFTAIILASMALSFVQIILSGGLGEIEQRDLYRTPTTRESLAAAGGAIVFILAYEIVTMARRCQTLGKQIMGLRVVTASRGEKPGRPRAAVRCLVWAVPFSVAAAFWSMPIVYGSTIPVALISLWALWDKDHRGLHDIIAGTVVIRPR